MILTLEGFLEKHGEKIEKYIELEEYDKGLELIENLFLVEHMNTEARIAAGTLATLTLARKFRQIILRGAQVRASMALNAVEEMAIKDNLSKLGEQEISNAKIN